MSLHVDLHDPDKAALQNFVSGGREMASVRFSVGAHAVTLYTGNRALAADLAQVFEMHGKDSPFLGVLGLLLAAEADPNRDTIFAVYRALNAHRDAICDCCGQYRPDPLEWHEIDNRLLCDDCCDAEAAKHSADVDAARLDAADHAFDAARDADLTPCHLRPVIEAHRIAQEAL